MPEMPKDTVEMLKRMSGVDRGLMDIYKQLQDNPTVPDKVKEALWKEVDKATPNKVSKFIRDSCIYYEYQTEKAKINPRLPLRKGEGGWYAAIADRYGVGDSAIETIVTKMRKFFEEP